LKITDRIRVFFNKKTRFFKWFKWLMLSAILLITAFVVFANFQIERSGRELVFNDINKIRHNKVGLLLGTSKYFRSGQPNQFYVNRITAATELLSAGKIDFIVISGDNSEKYYNEPRDMKNDLLKMGIPESRIILDYAGFRTYDSIIRLDKVFGQKSFIIISQRFHNLRAVYIAKSFGLDAIGYNAKDVDKYSGFKTRLREKFARVKVFIDLFVHKEPKFLGEKIEIK
jgi:SanA protein